VIGGWSTYYGSDAIRWWPDVDGQEFDGSSDVPRHERLVPAAYLVWMRNQTRRSQWFHYAREYGGFDQTIASAMGGLDGGASFDSGSAPYNVIRSATNTLTAKVIKNRPETMYLPVGGDAKLRRRIQYLNRFVTGLLLHANYYSKRHRRVRDAGLMGTGLLMHSRDGRRVLSENLQLWQVNVDPVDARDNDPRAIYIIRSLDKGVLKQRYAGKDARDEAGQPITPERRERVLDSIEAAPLLNEAFQPIADVYSMSNRCTVIQGIHLPSEAGGGGSRDGRDTVCLLDDTLWDKRWTRPEFPLTALVKDPSISGWYGLGLGDELSGFQERIAMMDERLEYAHRVVGGQIWLKPEGSQIYDTDFNDAIGVVVSHTPGMPPVPTNPQPVHEQTYEYFKGLIPDAYGFSGVSTMSAQSTKPAGVTAALALQTLDDIETDRFVGFERDDEETVNEDTRHMLHIVREIAHIYGDFTVLSAGRGAGERIQWMRDVNVPEDSYVVQAWAVSLMPKTPAAKMQRVLEYGANGYFNKAQVLKYTGLPDTTEEEALMLSAQDVCDAQIGHMLECECPGAKDGAGFLPPTEHQDCDYALSRAQSFYNKLQTDAIERGTIRDTDVIARLTNLDKYMQIAKFISDKAKAEAAAMQAQAMQAVQQGTAVPTPPAGAVQAPLTQQQAGPAAAPLAPAAPLSPA
jgi:hypothetical protein